MRKNFLASGLFFSSIILAFVFTFFLLTEAHATTPQGTVSTDMQPGVTFANTQNNCSIQSSVDAGTPDPPIVTVEFCVTGNTIPSTRPMNAFQLHFLYNPAILAPQTNTVANPAGTSYFLEKCSGGGEPIGTLSINTPGDVSIGGTALAPVSNSCITSLLTLGGRLATVQFQCIGAGSSLIDLQLDSFYNDTNGETHLFNSLNDGSLTSVSCQPPPPPTQCSDGIDNDGDGLVDFPNDPGCASANDNDETEQPQCSDLADNDGDGLVDFPNDPGCASANDNDETIPGDTDEDGVSDFEENASGSNPLNSLSTPEVCDSRDNDLDGTIDEKWNRDGDNLPDCQEFDTDNDGISKTIDNCPYAPDPSEKDSDNDGKGDVCEVLLSIDPPAISRIGGVSTISANIRIANYYEYGGLRGYEWKIGYDPRVLKFLSLVNGSFITTNGFTASCQGPVKTSVSSTLETLFFKCNAFGEGYGGTGNGILTNVTLEITGIGLTDLTFQDENLFNLGENNQTHIVGDFGEPLSKLSGLVAVCNDLQPGDIDVDLDGVPDSCDLELDNDNLAPSQEAQFGTNNSIPDTDADGLMDGVEVVAGLNPTKADTDGDGLTDGSVSSEDLDDDGLVGVGETSPNLPDSDFDGLLDGLERSLTAPETADTDLTRGNFVADSCPASSTDPTIGDTNGDGILDGFQDLNHNGCVDPGETDPNPPKDADADGILDPQDPCPLDPEDLDGYKDSDGCPELDAKDLRTAVQSLENINHGIRTSLLAKVNDLQNAQEAGDLASYNQALESFKSEVQAQSGKKLSVSDADALLALASSLTPP